MKSGRRMFWFSAAVLTVATSITSAAVAAPPTSAPPPPPPPPESSPPGPSTTTTRAPEVVDLGDDLALPEGVSVGAVAAPADGFTDLVFEDNGGQYTFRLVSGNGVEGYRADVRATVSALNAINGPYFTLAPGVVPAPANPVGYDPPPFEIHLMVSAESDCGPLGSSTIGCGGPRVFRQLGGVDTWTGGTVWLSPDLAAFSAAVRREVVLHEVGHALGLGHFDGEYEGRFQVMRSFVDSSITESGYRSGDVNGLEAKAPPPPANDAKAAATAISLARGAPGATWFATANGGPGQPELRAKYATASNRSVWFRFQARPQDVGRTLVVETGNDGSQDFDTLLGRVVNGALVAWNDDAAGARTSRLEFTPTDTRTVHYFVVDGKSRARGVTDVSIRPRGDGFVAIAPRRVADSRGRLGGVSGRWRRGTERSVRVAGVAGVPASATAVVLDVTALDATADGSLTVFAEGQPRPPANVSTRASGTTTAQVVVGLGTRDRVRIRNSVGTTHVLVDVVGYHVGRGGSGYRPVTPARVLDSRRGVGGPRKAWNHGVRRTVAIAGRGGVPGNATAVVLDLTAVGPRADGTATVWPAARRTKRPTAIAMSWSAGELTPTQVTVKLGRGGRIVVETATRGRLHLVADVVGWYGPGASMRYVPVTPTRLFDGSWFPNDTVSVSLAAARIPIVAGAANVNVAVPPSFVSGTATVWNGTGPRPQLWSIAWTGRNHPRSLVTTGVANGRFAIYNDSSFVNATVDVVGYYAP